MAAFKYTQTAGTWTQIIQNDKPLSAKKFQVNPRGLRPGDKYGTKTQNKTIRLDIPNVLFDGAVQLGMKVSAVHSLVEEPEYEEFWYLPEVSVWASSAAAPTLSTIPTASIQWNPVVTRRKNAIYHPELSGKVQISVKNKATGKTEGFETPVFYEPRSNQIRLGR